MRLLFLLLLSPLPAFSSLPPPPSLRRLRTRVQGEESPRGEGEGLCEALKDKPDVEFSLGGLLSHGDVLTNQIIGLQVEAYSNRLQGPGSAVIFDSNGSWENDVDLQVGVGNLVIIQDPTSRAPDDDRLGGSLTFRFACPVTVLQVTMVDIDDENVGTIMCYDENDIKLASVPIPNEGESSVNKLPVVVASVSTMRIALRSSGAVARIKIRVASPGGLTAAPIQEAVATSSPTVKKTTSPSVGLSSLSPTTVFPNKTNVPVAAPSSYSPSTDVPTQSPATNSPLTYFPSPLPTKFPSASPSTETPISLSPSSKSPHSVGPVTVGPATSAPSSLRPTTHPNTVSPRTDSPTPTPTRYPTNSPSTIVPTLSPSFCPTGSPATAKPSISPSTWSPSSFAPTVSPSQTPLTSIPSTSPSSRVPTPSTTSPSADLPICFGESLHCHGNGYICAQNYFARCSEGSYIFSQYRDCQSCTIDSETNAPILIDNC